MRSPAAIGFYPGEKEELKRMLEKLISKDAKKYDAIAAIVPHAGYIYSGKVAGATYSAIKTNKNIFAIFCPNHTGLGSKISLSQDKWLTPLGEVETLKFEKASESNMIKIDELAHKYEHSLEVQLPFLQYLFKDFSILPICLSMLSLKDIKKLANEIIDKRFFYIASSDFTHYGPMYGFDPFEGSIEEKLEKVKEMDMKAIDLILKIQPERFYNFVIDNDLTICGFIPITLLLFVLKGLGAKEGKLISYASSYEVSKNSSFVTYAGILIL
ncbi:MAG: AmmeMemoRadiSam system protein B [Candidatus Aenigmatarchaeota archaeon]